MDDDTKTEGGEGEVAELTFGQKAVGITFNPGGNPEVNDIKKLYAEIIDSLNNFRSVTESGEVNRLCSIAITEAQTAQMWAVKAITWQVEQVKFNLFFT